MSHPRIWVTSGEAARRLGVAANTIHRLADEGQVGTLKIPGVRVRRFRVADIDRLLDESSTPARRIAATAGN